MAVTAMSVEEELKKNPELKREDVDRFKEWVASQPHLPDVPELDLVHFLHSCYYSMERAKQTLDTYYTMRTHVPEFFSSRDPTSPSMAYIMKVVTFVVLPDLTPTGEKVLFCKLYDCEPSHYMFADALKLFLFINDLELYEHGTRAGYRVVFDMDGLAFGHIPRIGVMTVKKFLCYLQDAMPLRLKGIHFVNVVSFVDKVLAIMKPFMKQELMELLYIHSEDWDFFYSKVPKDILPSDVGGKLPNSTALRDSIYEKIIANKEFFLREEKLRVKESLRPGKPKNAGDLFGVEGSFKKLDID